MDGNGTVLVPRAHFKGMYQVDKKVLLAENAISVVSRDVLLNNQYAYL